MKYPPREIERLTIKSCVYFASGRTLQDLINDLPPNIEWKDFTFFADTCDSDSYFSYEELESDEAFNIRLIEYERQVDEYQQWRLDNKDAIQKLEEKEKAQLLKAQELNRIHLEKERRQLTQKLKQIEKELST